MYEQWKKKTLYFFFVLYVYFKTEENFALWYFLNWGFHAVPPFLFLFFFYSVGKEGEKIWDAESWEQKRFLGFENRKVTKLD